jgi:hypothetical protein
MVWVTFTGFHLFSGYGSYSYLKKTIDKVRLDGFTLVLSSLGESYY